MPVEPLGWDGPVQAREIRTWTTEAIEAVSKWSLVDPPEAVVVLDSVRLGGGRFVQKYVISGTVFESGDLLLFVHYPTGPVEVVATGFALQPFNYSSARPQDVTPAGHFRTRRWVHGGQGVRVGEQVVVSGHPPGESVCREVLFLDFEGGLAHPVARVNGAVGRVLGALSDGAVLFWGADGYEVSATDTLVTQAIVSARPTPARCGSPGSEEVDPVLTFAMPRDMASGYPRPRSSWHLPHWKVAVSGDTIWTVPTERPELLAVHRSGEVVLRVDWESGDRSLATELRDDDDWKGLERFPAASELRIGSNGLVYVQRWTLRDGWPRNRGDWLVFDPTGDLVARVELPREFYVIAFGDGFVVGSRRNAAGFNEVVTARFTSGAE